MNYNFDKEINRKGTDSVKWDLKNCKAAMWVADMDFEVAPCIQDAVQERTDLHVFGYNQLPKNYYRSIQNWWLQRHKIGYDTKMMQFVNGVIPALSAILGVCSAPGDHIVMLSPIYHTFYEIIEANGRLTSSSQMRLHNEQYEIDWQDLEERIANPRTSIFLLSNPHNPAGILWDKETLEKIGALCAKYNVLVVSDEIHCDIVSPGKQYVPFAKVNRTCKENSIILVSATKAFNIAGLQSACCIIPNAAIRKKVFNEIQARCLHMVNNFGAFATIAAYEYGEDWLDEMNAYVDENKKVAKEFLLEYFPQLTVLEGDATYLMWVDFSKFSKDASIIADQLLKEMGLFVEKGSTYGPGGQSFIRLNVACPRNQMLEGLMLLREGLETRKMQRLLADKGPDILF